MNNSTTALAGFGWWLGGTVYFFTIKHFYPDTITTGLYIKLGFDTAIGIISVAALTYITLNRLFTTE